MMNKTDIAFYPAQYFTCQDKLWSIEPASHPSGLKADLLRDPTGSLVWPMPGYHVSDDVMEHAARAKRSAIRFWIVGADIIHRIDAPLPDMPESLVDTISIQYLNAYPAMTRKAAQLLIERHTELAAIDIPGGTEITTVHDLDAGMDCVQIRQIKAPGDVPRAYKTIKLFMCPAKDLHKIRAAFCGDWYTFTR